MEESGGRESLLLAVLFHDPPWKPWGIHGDKIQGGGPVWQRLLASFKRSGDPLLVKVARGFEQGGGVYEEFRRCASDPESCRIRKHELQSLLLVMALSEALRGEGCEDLAALVEDAGRKILREDPQVRRADRLASALDRVLLHWVLEEAGERGMQEDELRLVNPFNPRYKTTYRDENGNLVRLLRQKLDEEDKKKLARFVAGYARLVARLAKHAGCDKAYLVHAAFALLEPAWYHYMAAGGDPVEYAPPADTRIPTHTVFDHVNVALAAALWTGESEEPRGCLLTVDLAGVQSWIGESRRLRDLWAASWLASLLAWKSVEPLVRKYGPGVLIQPPARLHPFYSSNIILRPLGARYEEVVGGEKEWVFPGLGLPLGWPVDPTVPSVVTIALPPEACKEAKNEVLKHYKKAWKYILNRALAATHPDLILGGALSGKEKEFLEKLKDLEPPLAIRVYTVDLSDAYRHALEAGESGRETGLLDYALEYIEKYAPKQDIEGVKEQVAKLATRALSRKRVADALFYYEALKCVARRKAEVILSAPGRRTGQTYAYIYDTIYQATGGNPKRMKACTVCGVAPAVFYKPEDDKPQFTTPVKEKNTLQRIVWSEVGEEALCPYCYVKRVLRTLILRDRTAEQGNPAVSEELTGLPAPRGEARERLQWTSVSRMTSRITLQADKIRGLVEEAARILLEGFVGEKEGLEWVLIDFALTRIPPDTILTKEQRRQIVKNLVGKYGNGDLEELYEDLVRRVEYIIMELLTDEAYRAELEKLLSRVLTSQEKASQLAAKLEALVVPFRRYARRYTVLRADGDYMGRVLNGRLALNVNNVDPDRVRRIYAESILNIHKRRDPNARIVRFAMIAVIYALTRYAENNEDMETIQLIIPTPSYHMTVSRSLALLSSLDRMTVEAGGGMVVYAGGDDLLAITPPASAKDGRISYDSLAIVGETRRSYWGLGGRAPGFNRLAGAGVAPGLNAYGRTYTLHYADLKKPMWLEMRLTSEIEESKDGSLIRVYDADKGVLWVVRGKDLVFVSSDAGGLSAVPALLDASRTGGPERDHKAPADAVIELLYHLDEKQAPYKVSTSLLYDAIELAKLVYTAALRAGGREAALDLLRSLFARNTVPGDAVDRLLEVLAQKAVPNGRVEGLVDYRVEYDGLSARTALETGYAWPDENDKRRAIQILAYSIIGATRVTRSALE